MSSVKNPSALLLDPIIIGVPIRLLLLEGFFAYPLVRAAPQGAETEHRQLQESDKSTDEVYRTDNRMGDRKSMGRY